jgi:HlyD family secretion protein
MPAETMINTGHRTAMAYLLQPLSDSMNRAWREQ